MAVAITGSIKKMSNGRSSGVTSASAKYVKIKQQLMQGIASGRYPVGTYLPSESELCKLFDASRVTVRMALDLLHEARVLTGHQGKGHYVCPIKAEQDLGRLQGFGEIMAPLELDTYSKVISGGRSKADAKVAAKLDLSKGDDVVRIERIRMAGKKPMSVDISYFPIDIGDQLLALNLEGMDVFELLDSSVTDGAIGFADIAMDMVYPKTIVRDHLKLPDSERVIRIERLTHNVDGRPIDFEYLFGHPETYRFKLRVPRW